LIGLVLGSVPRSPAGVGKALGMKASGFRSKNQEVFPNGDVCDESAIMQFHCNPSAISMHIS
jgi:hypothetical protein